MADKEKRVSPAQEEILNKILFDAVKNGSSEEVKLCLKKGADVNVRDSNGDTPVMWAVYKGWETIAAILIANDADLLIKGNDGRTVFDHAKGRSDQNSRQRFMRMLLEALPDPVKNGEPEDSRKKDFNAAALPHDVPVTTPIVMKPPKKDGGDLEL